jgi:hypothetical protein
LVSNVTFNYSSNIINLPSSQHNYNVIGDFTSGISFSIHASDGTANPSSTQNLNFLSRFYYGTSPLSTGYSNAQILALANQPLVSNRNLNTSINGNGQYVVFAYPVSFGAGNFSVGGFSSTLNQSTQLITNANGYTTNYYIYTTGTVVNNSTTFIIT